MDLILDASVAVKWFNSKNEYHVEQALYIQNKMTLGEINIIVPDLFFLEVLNALITKSGFKTEDISTIKDILIKMNLEIIHPDDLILKDSVNIASENNLTIYDALYIAVARSSDASLVTEDKKILSCISKYSFIKHIKDFSRFSKLETEI